MIITDGFIKPIPNTMTSRNEPNINNHDIRDNPYTIINDPKYATSPNLRGPPNNLKQIDGIGGYRTQVIGNPDSLGTGTVGSGPGDPKYATSPNLRGPPNSLPQTDGLLGVQVVQVQELLGLIMAQTILWKGDFLFSVLEFRHKLIPTMWKMETQIKCHIVKPQK